MGEQGRALAAGGVGVDGDVVAVADAVPGGPFGNVVEPDLEVGQPGRGRPRVPARHVGPIVRRWDDGGGGREWVPGRRRRRRPAARRRGLVPEEDERVGVEALAEALDRAQGEVALAPLDAADEGAVDGEGVGERFLGEAALLAEQAQVAPEPLLQVAFHGRDRRSLLLDGLQTDQ